MTATESRFRIDDLQLGAGGYGKVYTALDTVSGEKVAAKVIATGRMKLAAIMKEVGLMSKLAHPGVIALRGHEEVDRHFIIYMELADKGELFSRVINSGSLREAEALPYFKQLMGALRYLHANGVVHRDLKLENVLLSSADECKVCDFGLAHVFGRDASGAIEMATLREVCGSKSYCAPEVLEGKGYQGFGVDVWSCGICLFAMLAGFFPLDEASGSDWRFERAKMAAASGYSVSHAIFGFYERPCALSREVSDLIDGMLIVDPSRRLSVDDVLGSAWCTGAKVADDAGPRYRGNLGGSGEYDPAAVAALMAAAGEPAAPVYRGGPPQGPPPAPPPALAKQEPFFCADFHEAP